MMFILKPELDEEAVNAAIERFTGIIANHGGVIDSVDKWGKRRLAYEINKIREGVYVLVYFRGEPGAAQELERVLKLSDEVVRQLIIRKDETPAAKEDK
jgi:small subunit ribosomal protein S6